MGLLDGNDGDGAKAREVLDFCLRDESPELRGQVYEIIARSGLDPSDPMFLVLALTGQIRVFLEAAPLELGLLLENWRDQSASSLSEITEAISRVKQIQQEQAEAIRENMDSVSSKYVSGIKEAGMATALAITEANSDALSLLHQLKAESAELMGRTERDRTSNQELTEILIKKLHQTTDNLNSANLEFKRTVLSVKKMQQQMRWSQYHAWFSPLLALLAMGITGGIIGSWLTSQALG